MGLFGLFDKKICAICGNEIGLLGNRKLEDGDCCKDCASLLSPWMTDRRTSTVAEIRDHIDYRRANFDALQYFNATRVIGERTKVYIDEAQGKFIVTRSTDWRKTNPDIIDIDQVARCNVKIEEHRREIAPPPPPAHPQPVGGSMGPGRPAAPHAHPAPRPMPPRIEFSYEFDVEILINSPYFDRIRFELTGNRPDSRISPDYRHYEAEAQELMERLDPQYRARPTVQQVIQQVVTNIAPVVAAVQEQNGWTCSCGQLNQGKFCFNCGAKKPPEAPLYRCDKCGWTPDDPKNPPKFCPQCGDRFDDNDIQ